MVRERPYDLQAYAGLFVAQKKRFAWSSCVSSNFMWLTQHFRYTYIYNYIYMRAEQKILSRGLHCEGPGVCKYQSRLKFFPEMAKEFFLLAKDLAKVYVM